MATESINNNYYMDKNKMRSEYNKKVIESRTLADAFGKFHKYFQIACAKQAYNENCIEFITRVNRLVSEFTQHTKIICDDAIQSLSDANMLPSDVANDIMLASTGIIKFLQFSRINQAEDERITAYIARVIPIMSKIIINAAKMHEVSIKIVNIVRNAYNISDDNVIDYAISLCEDDIYIL